MLGSGRVPRRSAAVLRKAKRTQYTPLQRHKQGSDSASPTSAVSEFLDAITTTCAVPKLSSLVPGVRVEIRRTGWQAHRLDARRAPGSHETLHEQRIPIMKQETLPTPCVPSLPTPTTCQTLPPPSPCVSRTRCVASRDRVSNRCTSFRRAFRYRLSGAVEASRFEPARSSPLLLYCLAAIR